MGILFTAGPYSFTIPSDAVASVRQVPDAPPPVVNQAPRIAASATMGEPESPGTYRIDLVGQLLDDDRIPSPAQVLWQFIQPLNSGFIDDVYALQTFATVFDPGVYVLRFSATDGELDAQPIDVRIEVREANQAPTVFAGQDRIFEAPVDSTTTFSFADATVSDESPVDDLSLTWTVQGPGAVHFGGSDGDLHRQVTLPNAYGRWTFTLTAIDSAGAEGSDSVVVERREPQTTVPPDVTPGDFRIGAGMGEPVWYETGSPYMLNRMLLGDGWTWNAAGWGDGTPHPLTPDGYPTQISTGEHVVCALPNTPGGDHVVTWDGTGEVQLMGPGTFSQREGDNSISVTISGQDKSGGPLMCTLWSTDPADPVRNIKILPAGAFVRGPDDLDPSVRGAVMDMARGGVLRFMDWNRVNTAWWRDITQTDAPPALPQRSYSLWATGAPPEACCHIAAEVSADVWLCLQDAYTDEAVREYATRVRDSLAQGQVAYIELSNELWNFGFLQTARYVAASEDQLGITGELHRPYLAHRLHEVSRIFAEVFGADFGTRCKMVLAHIVDAEAEHEDKFNLIYWREFKYMLDYVHPEHGTPLSAWVHATSTHGYFGTGALSGAADVQTVVDRCRGNIRSLGRAMTRFAAASRALGLEPTMYEGGQHLTWATPEEETLSRQVLAAPEMEALYDEHVLAMQNAGMGALCYFTATGDFWGHQQDVFADYEPRAVSLMNARDRVNDA